MLMVMVRRVRGALGAGTPADTGASTGSLLTPPATSCGRAAIRPGDLVVDLGAGHGALTSALLDAGARVVAVELHPARARLAARAVRRRRGDRRAGRRRRPCACPDGRSASSPTHRGPSPSRSAPTCCAPRPGARRPRAAALAGPPLGRAIAAHRRRVVAARRVVQPARADGQRGRRAPRPAVPGGDRYRHAVPVEPPCLFVYGTLQPGRLRWPFLEPFAIGHRPADVYGELFDSGYGWPVARTRDERRRPRPGHARRPRPRTGRRGARR